MKLMAFLILLVTLASVMVNCSSQHSVTAPPSLVSQTKDVSPLVPADLSYAREFVQLLRDAGWSTQVVRHSKFNSFFRDTNKAAFIMTDKGVVEVIFFDREDDVEQIRVQEDESPSTYRYIIEKPPRTKQSIVGGSPTYFIKHRNMFMITIDPDLSDGLNRLLAQHQN
jgi:hypothetical protein